MWEVSNMQKTEQKTEQQAGLGMSFCEEEGRITVFRKTIMALVRMIYGDSGWDKKMSYRLIGRAFPQQRLVSFKITDAMQIENGRVLTEM